MPRTSKFRMRPKVGPHYYNGKKYISGDEINLPEHAAKGIMFKLERIGDAPKEEIPEVGFQIVALGDDKYKVVNEDSGESINDDPLTLKEARAIAGDSARLVDIVKDGRPELKARHRGGGRYLITNEKTGQPIVPDLFNRKECNEIIHGRATIAETLIGRK